MRGLIYLIAITKKEKEAVLAKYPKTHVVRTMRGDSRRHHYYCTENKGVMALIAKMRGWDARKGYRVDG